MKVTKILASTHEISDLHTKVLDFSVKISKALAGALLVFDDMGKLFIASASAHPYGADFFGMGIFPAVSEWVVDHEEPLVLKPRQSIGQRKNFHHLPNRCGPILLFL